MYHLAMLIPLLALAMMQPTPVDLKTGTRLYHSCQEAKKMVLWKSGQDCGKAKALNAEGAKVADGSNDVHNDQVSECLAYIGGYIDGSHVSDDHLFCMGEVTVGTTIAVYLAFMDRNPKFLDSPRALGLGLALMEAYPCPAKGK